MRSTYTQGGARIPINAHLCQHCGQWIMNSDMSLRETAGLHERNPLVADAKDTGCCQAMFEFGVVSCLKGEGRRPSLPEPKRPDIPLSHNQYELQECFPCAYRPLHYFVLDRLPFLRWLLQYNVRWLVSDVVAGLTVGLMVVPQALAYARIANLRLKVSFLLQYASPWELPLQTVSTHYRPIVFITNKYVC